MKSRVAAVLVVTLGVGCAKVLSDDFRIGGAPEGGVCNPGQRQCRSTNYWWLSGVSGR